MSGDDRYTREERDGVTVIRVQRQLSVPEAVDVMKEVAAAGTSDRRLWAVGNHFDYSSADVRRLSDLGRRLWPDPARVAYVASSGVFYGMIRMYEALRDQEGYETRAFLSEEDAMVWLRS